MMHATTALDYLILDKARREQYLDDHGFSTQMEWYDSFKPQPIEGDFLGFDATLDLLCLERSRAFALLEDGFFEESVKKDGKRLFKVSELNKILEKEAYLVPVQSFHDLLARDQWYIGTGKFYRRFRQYFEQGMDREGKYVSLLNAAKIVCRMKKRKAMIEDWPTLSTLNRESGLNLNEDAMRNRYRKMIKNNRLRVVIVGKYSPEGKHICWEQKIAPYEYERILKNEQEAKSALDLAANGGMRSADIAAKMGLTSGYITEKIVSAEKEGLLHPLRLTCRFKKGGGNGNYILTAAEAALLIERKITIPTRSTLLRRQQRELIASGNLYIASSLSLDRLSRSVEKDLWQKVRERDDNSFNILLTFYQPIIDKEAEEYMFGSLPEERKLFLYTALFEAVHSAGRRTTREQIIASLRRSLLARKKEEVPSFLSLDCAMRNDPNNATYLDMVDENHQINT